VVLVADDEPTMLELVAGHLRSSQPKMEVIEASDGDEAWRLAKERLPDLVVLDVMMPGMSGWEVCRKIRQDAALAHTGVLMLTGIGENLNEATSPLFGADEYIDKPFDFDRLDEKIETVLERRAVQREAVPRPVGEALREHAVDNGVGGPATPVVRAPPKRGPKKAGVPKKAVARKSAAKKARAKKATAKKATAKKATAKKATAKRATAKRATAKRATANKAAPAKKARTQQYKPAKVEKGKRKMAAKKGAKKAAKKVAKKTAKKAAKKAKKK
jgi:DNA-binding response OmpR family regulator